MNEKEIVHLLKKITARWPNFKIQDLDITIEVFLEDLGDQDYAAVDKVYRSYKGKAFAPTLSEVMAILEPPPEDDDGWMVRRAWDVSFMNPDENQT